MKKLLITSIIISMALIITLSFGGCDRMSILNPKLDLNKSYELNAEIRHNENSAKALIKRLNEDVWEVTLTDPFPLQGIVLEYKNGEMSLTYEGLSVELDCVLQTAACVAVQAMENAFCDDIAQISSKDNILTIEGVTEKGGYILKIDKNQGVPQSLIIPDKKIEIIFTEGKKASLIDQGISPTEDGDIF